MIGRKYELWLFCRSEKESRISLEFSACWALKAIVHCYMGSRQSLWDHCDGYSCSILGESKKTNDISRSRAFLAAVTRTYRPRATHVCTEVTKYSLMFVLSHWERRAQLVRQYIGENALISSRRICRRAVAVVTASYWRWYAMVTCSNVPSETTGYVQKGECNSNVH